MTVTIDAATARTIAELAVNDALEYSHSASAATACLKLLDAMADADIRTAAELCRDDLIRIAESEVEDY